MIEKKCQCLLIVCSTIIFTACGGGGGNSGNDVQAVPNTSANTAQNTAIAFPVQLAMENYYSTSQTYDMIGTATAADGRTLNIIYSYSHTPGPNTTFEGNVTKSVQMKLLVKQNAANVQPILTLNATQYIRTAPYNQLGAVAGALYSVATSIQGSLPVTAKIGDSGPLETTTIYTSPSKTVTVGTPTPRTWSLEADTSASNTALLCFRLNPTNGSTNSSCHRITTTGAVVGHNISGTEEGINILASN